MKRILAILTSACMLLSLAACGGAQSQDTGSSSAQETSASGNSQKTVINVWTHTNDPWDKANLLNEQAFEAEYPEYDVVYKTFPYGDFLAKMQTSLMSDDFADIYEIWGGWASEFVDAGALAEVPESLTSTFGDFYEPTLGSYSKDGKYYGVPEEFNLEYGMLFCNKKLFEEANLEYPKTWEDLKTISEQVAVKDGESMVMRGYDIVNVDVLLHCWLSNIISLGGTYFTEEEGFNFNTPEAIEVMDEMKSFVTNGYTNLDDLTNEGGGSTAFFGKDQSFMFTKGVWVMPELKDSFGKEYGRDFDVLALPGYTSKTVTTAETGWGLAVPEKSKNKEAAWKYIEFCMRPENLLRHNLACGQIPPKKSVATSEEYLTEAPYMKNLLPTLESGKYIGRFNTEILKNNLINLFTDLCTNPSKTTQEALAEFTDLLNAEIK